jgi:hypothetical protein
VLRTVFAPPSHMRLEHITTVEEWHFTVGLDPDLVAGVRRNDGERCDV